MDYFTSSKDLLKIYHLLNIDVADVTNVYNFGSHVHGTATPSSDYDILIVGKFSQKPLKFKNP